jgi:two-component system cell cycle sensor histidine kinase/response regulator CckA
MIHRELGARMPPQHAVVTGEDRTYRALFESNPVPMWVFDRESLCFLAVNEAAIAKYGWSREEFGAMTIRDIRAGEDQPSLTAALDHSNPGRHHAGRFRHRRHDGSALIVDVVSHGLNFDGRDARLVMAFDVTDREQAVAALHEANHRLQERDAEYRVMTDGIPLCIVYVDNALVVQFVNRRCEELAGRVTNDLVGRPLAELLGREGAARAADAMRDTTGDASITWEFTRVVEDAPPQHWAVSQVRRDGPLGSPIGCYLMLQDITQQRALEEQFRHAQKMEAVGRLAGGIAHDFNNLLTVILSYGDLILADRALPDESRADVAQIQAAARRAADLTRQLLAFSRKQRLSPTLLALDAVVAGLTPMLGRLLGETITLVHVPAPEPGRVLLDPSQIEQVLVNLAVNARDAMPQGGRLTIETRDVRLDDTYVWRHAEIAPGDYVRLTVSDTGVGMSADVRSHAFEPFFTTKEPGKGTGLGLSTVYGIVQQSGGHVWLYSEPGLGTTFRLFFPRVRGAAAVEPAPDHLEDPGGTETILLAEDEEAVRTLAVRALRMRGYAVIAAASGEEALRIAAERVEPVDLLVTDMVMPGMNGRELAHRLRDGWPGMRVLLVSGYSHDERGGADEAADGGVLLKPFSPASLARAVRSAIDGRANPAVAGR